MQKVLVLSLMVLFLLSSSVGAFSAQEWWLENRRSTQTEEETDEAPPPEEKEQKDEEYVEETSFADWWLNNRRSYDSEQEQKQPEEEKDEEREVKTPAINNEAEEYLFNAINEERQERGIDKLEYSNEVSEVARLKSRDMVENDYYAHESPTYGSAADMLRSENISFSVSKENLSKHTCEKGAHSALMSSSGHRSGILGERYTHVGIGVAETAGGGVMVTQIFIER